MSPVYTAPVNNREALWRPEGPGLGQEAPLRAKDVAEELRLTFSGCRLLVWPHILCSRSSARQGSRRGRSGRAPLLFWVLAVASSVVVLGSPHVWRS